MRARGSRPSSCARSADITSTAAAPSLRGQELPAVTGPPSRDAGFSPPSTSIVGPGRGPAALLLLPPPTDTPVPPLSVSGGGRGFHSKNSPAEGARARAGP